MQSRINSFPPTAPGRFYNKHTPVTKTSKGILRYILVVPAGIAVFLAGLGCGWFAGRPVTPAAALEQSYRLLDRELSRNGELKQRDLNEYAAMMHTLADMQRRLLEKSDDSASEWLKYYENELEKPLSHVGGSMAPMERSLRGYRLQLERIRNLKQR